MGWLARCFGSGRFRGGLAAVISLLVAVAATGLLRLEFDDNHRKLFRGSGDAYEQLERLAGMFPLDENDFILLLEGTSGNLLWKWGAEKIPAGEAINAKLSGDSGRFSNEDSGDFIKLQPA